MLKALKQTLLSAAARAENARMADVRKVEGCMLEELRAEELEMGCTLAGESRW